MINEEKQEQDWKKAVEAHYEHVKKVGKLVKEFGLDGDIDIQMHLTQYREL